MLDKKHFRVLDQTTLDETMLDETTLDEMG
jgi:hypothetical protein